MPPIETLAVIVAARSVARTCWPLPAVAESETVVGWLRFASNTARTTPPWFPVRLRR